MWPKECEEVAAGRWVNEEVDVCPPREEAGGWWPREASRRARASRLREELLRRRPVPEPDEAEMMRLLSFSLHCFSIMCFIAEKVSPNLTALD